MRIFANANFDFLGARKASFLGSGALILVTLVMALVWQFNQGSWLNYGVDFTGGTLVQVRFETETSVGEVREVASSVAPGVGVTGFGGENEYLVRAPQFTDDETGTADLIVGALDEAFGPEAFEVVRTEAVGAKVGAELQRKAALAILLSLAFVLVYLAFRFEWRYGLATVIATAHDVLLTLGFIAMFQLEVSLTTIAAVLTVLGYSLNDSIVIFDRVREKMKSNARRQPIYEIMNRAINETLPRTVMTSFTTMVVLLALFLLGGSVIRDFALILLFGVVVGSYSSVFMAAPALLEIQWRWPPQERKKKTSGRGGTRPKKAGVPA